MYKKVWCTCKVVVLLIKPIVFLTFSRPSRRWIFGLVHTYPDIFEHGVSKKYASTRGVFESFSPVHTKTQKRWKNDSIRSWTCIMLEVYDVWHYRIRKSPFSSTRNRKADVFKNFHSGQRFWKDAFCDRFHRPNRRKQYYHLTNQILICIPGGHEPRVISVDVSVFMQKERIMPLLLSTVESRWNCGDLWLFELSSSVSWYLLPMSQWNPFASGHPDAAFGIPYVPAGQ